MNVGSWSGSEDGLNLGSWSGSEDGLRTGREASLRTLKGTLKGRLMHKKILDPKGDFC